MKAVAILLSFSLILLTSGTPWIPEEKGDGWWQDNHHDFVENTRTNNGSIQVLFYGDSITYLWKIDGKPVFDQYYGSLGTANYGIPADKTEHLIWRMRNGEVTDNLSPDVCILKIGTNNIGLGSEDDVSIAMGVVFTVRELRERLPHMKILLLGLLPRENEEISRRTQNINEIIKHLDNGNSVRFLDMSEHFWRGGDDLIKELYWADLLHLTEAGYKVWAEVMDPLFREMLN